MMLDLAKSRLHIDLRKRKKGERIRKEEEEEYEQYLPKTLTIKVLGMGHTLVFLTLSINLYRDNEISVNFRFFAFSLSRFT